MPKVEQNLLHAPWTAPRINELKTDVGSHSFSEALREITNGLLEQVTIKDPGDVCVIEVPRGGSIPTLALLLNPKIADAKLARANVGSKRLESEPMLGDDFPIVAEYIIPDGIMATGGTMIQVVQAIIEKWSASGRQGQPHFTILCPIVSELGLKQTNNFFTWANKNNVCFKVVTAHLERSGGFVDFGSKTALIVGDHKVDEQGNLVSAQIGDYGDMTAQMQQDNILLQSIVSNLNRKK